MGLEGIATAATTFRRHERNTHQHERRGTGDGHDLDSWLERDG